MLAPARRGVSLEASPREDSDPPACLPRLEPRSIPLGLYALPPPERGFIGGRTMRLEPSALENVLHERGLADLSRACNDVKEPTRFGEPRQ